jgi:hypothetical protein
MISMSLLQLVLLTTSGRYSNWNPTIDRSLCQEGAGRN